MTRIWNKSQLILNKKWRFFRMKTNNSNNDDIKQLYRRKKWNETKQLVIARDEGRCQECKQMITGRFIIHHKIPANKENFYDMNNLELVCQNCHNRLTFHDDVNKNHRQVKLLENSDDLIPF